MKITAAWKRVELPSTRILFSARGKLRSENVDNSLARAAYRLYPALAIDTEVSLKLEHFCLPDVHGSQAVGSRGRAPLPIITCGSSKEAWAIMILMSKPRSGQSGQHRFVNACPS